MNGKTQEKLDVSHTAIGFPWGFTQLRPSSALCYICNTRLISGELWMQGSETWHPVFTTGKKSNTKNQLKSHILLK